MNPENGDRRRAGTPRARDKCQRPIKRREGADIIAGELPVARQRAENPNDPADAAIAYRILGNVRARSWARFSRASSARVRRAERRVGSRLERRPSMAGGACCHPGLAVPTDSCVHRRRIRLADEHLAKDRPIPAALPLQPESWQHLREKQRSYKGRIYPLCARDHMLPDARESFLVAPASVAVDTRVMTRGRASWLLALVGSALPFAGNGCSNSTKASLPDAAADAAISSGGTASGGGLGAGGGSAGSSGKGSGGVLTGGTGGSSGTPATGGTTAPGGATGLGGKTGSGGTTSTGGATGLGGTMSSGGASGHSGAADGGDADAPAATSTDGGSGVDGAVDGGAEPHCVGTAPSSCPTYSPGYCPPGCWLQTGYGNCAGTPHSCSYNTTAKACAAQVGCAWSDATPTCTGTPATCSYGLTYDQCLAAGCQPLGTDPTCFGTPTPCSRLSAAACSSQSGCTVSTF
jgi:hypothetical protein